MRARDRQESVRYSNADVGKGLGPGRMAQRNSSDAWLAWDRSCAAARSRGASSCMRASPKRALGPATLSTPSPSVLGVAHQCGHRRHARRRAFDLPGIAVLAGALQVAQQLALSAARWDRSPAPPLRPGAPPAPAPPCRSGWPARRARMRCRTAAPRAPCRGRSVARRWRPGTWRSRSGDRLRSPPGAPVRRSPGRARRVPAGPGRPPRWKRGSGSPARPGGC